MTQEDLSYGTPESNLDPFARSTLLRQSFGGDSELSSLSEADFQYSNIEGQGDKEYRIQTPPRLARTASTGTVRQTRVASPVLSPASPLPIITPQVQSDMPVSSTAVDSAGNPLTGEALMRWLARNIEEDRRAAGTRDENLDGSGRPLGPNGQPLTGDELTHWLIRQWLSSRASQGSANIVTPGSSLTSSTYAKITAKEIGYFYPRYVKPGESQPTTDFIVEVGDVIHYTSVSAFLDRIQDMIVPHGPALIKQQLIQCLRGEAATWYSQELDITDKMTIRDDSSSNLIQFSSKLKKRFRVNKSDALDRFYGSIYTTYDAKAGRHLRDFVSAKHIQGREADMPADQLPIMIHNMIDPSFQLAMMDVTDYTTFQEYREHCSLKGDLFIKMYKGSLSSNSSFTPRKGFGSDMSRPNYGANPLPVMRGEARSANTRGGSGDAFRGMNRSATPTGSRGNQTMGPDGKLYANPQNLSRPCRHCAAANVVAFHKDPECSRVGGRPSNRAVAAHWVNSDEPDNTLPWDKSDRNIIPAVETFYNSEAPQFSYDDPQVETYHADARNDYSIPQVSEPPSFDSPAQGSLKQIKGTGSHSISPSLADAPSGELSLRGEGEIECGNESIVNKFAANRIMSSTCPPIPSSCNICDKQFHSRSSLFRHLRTEKHDSPSSVLSYWSSTPEIGDIIESTSTPCSGTGVEFKDFDYAKIKTRFTPDGFDNMSCLDTGTSLSSIDRRLVLDWMKVEDLATPISVSGLGGTVNKSSQFTVLSLFIPNEKRQLVKLAARKFHVVDKLECGILVGNDVSFNEGFLIDPAREELTISAAKDSNGTEVTVPIVVVRPKLKPVAERIFLAERASVLPGNICYLKTAPTKRLQEGLKYEFFPRPISLGASAVGCFFDKDTTGVLFRNRSNVVVELNSGTEIGLCEVSDEETYDVPEGFAPLFMTLAEQGFSLEQGDASESHVKVKLCDDVNASGGLQGQDESRKYIGEDGKPFGSGHVTVNTSKITPAQIEALRKVVRDHEELFTEKLGQVREPEEEWLEIPIKPGETLKSPGVYKLSERDKAVIDKTFDPLRKQGLLEPAKGPVGWPVFVIWKNGKGRVVVDLRGLNAATVADAYPLPRQEEIMALLRDCEWITCVDVRSSFYQRLVKLCDRYKLSIVSHGGQEMFGVAVMGFCNSAAHCQRLYDRILPPDFAKCYVDDMVVFSKTFEDHVRHLTIVFDILSNIGITLAPEKCFIGYHSVELLGHVVDRFGLYTNPQKVKAIQDIEFPKTLQQLENWVGITGYYRHFCENYSRLNRPLQDRKTAMLKFAPAKKRARLEYCRATKVDNPTDAEKESFRLVKEAICSDSVLIHHDSTVPVLYRLDASYEDGFAGAVMQVSAPVMEANSLTVDDIAKQAYNRKLERPILFISRELSAAEHNYWPTELETQCCVWAIQKTRHIVEQNPKVIVFTDHQAIVAIAKMRSLKTQSLDRSNKKLIRASQFLSQYPHIEIRHVSGESNVGPDRLSRLKKAEGPMSPEVQKLKETRSKFFDEEDVDTDYLFLTTVSYVGTDLKSRISLGYEADPHYANDFARYREMLKEARLSTPDCNQVSFAQFVFRQEEDGPGLIYMEDPVDGHLRLCLPRNVWLDVFHEAHDNLNHANVDRAIRILRQDYYIKNMHKELKKYCDTCPSCEVNATKRHPPYGLLQPVKTPSSIWQVVGIDFVVKLPPSRLLGFLYDSFLSVTDKFSKAIILVPGREDWNAKQWAEGYYRSVWKHWGFPQAIISDRGGQFLSLFWTSLFKKAGTRLHTTTAYHAQADGQSEMTNQIVEIALRHLVNGRQDDWIEYLPFVEANHNNAINTSTGKSPNEILFGATHRNALDTSILSEAPEAEAFSKQRENMRLEAAEALTFAASRMKTQYDKHHRQIDIPVGSYVNIRYSRSFEKGYAPRNVQSAKLANQRGGRYQVVEKVGNLAYKLDLRNSLPGTHPVFSVEHLEPCPAPDEYHRKPVGEPPVLIDGHDKWEISKILSKAIRGHGRNRGVYYLVRWKGYDGTEDEWIPISHLQNASKKVKEFESRRLLLPADKVFEAKLADLKRKRKPDLPPVVEALPDDSDSSDSDSDDNHNFTETSSHFAAPTVSPFEEPIGWEASDKLQGLARRLHVRKVLSRPGVRGRQFKRGCKWGEAYAFESSTPTKVRFDGSPMRTSKS